MLSLESPRKPPNKLSANSEKKKSGTQKCKDDSITVVKGSKAKPGLISFTEDKDHRLGRKVAFLIDSKEGRSLLEYFDKSIPNEAIQIYTKKSDPIKFLVGVVHKRSTKKKRKNCYTVAWEWSCATLYEVDFEVTAIDRAISQYNNISQYMRYSSSAKYTKEEQHLHDRSILKR